jgi:hypothetical protein
MIKNHIPTPMRKDEVIVEITEIERKEEIPTLPAEDSIPPTKDKA